MKTIFKHGKICKQYILNTRQSQSKVSVLREVFPEDPLKPGNNVYSAHAAVRMNHILKESKRVMRRESLHCKHYYNGND